MAAFRPPSPAPSAPAREVSVRNDHPRLRLAPEEIVRAVTALESGLPALRIAPDAVPHGELSIVFLTDPALAAIHGEFMDDPTATDVITFAGDPAAGLAGEICVSADMAARYVGLLPGGNRSKQHAFATELTLYLVHGWLHLVGHDDLQPAKKRKMRAAEKRAMTLLRQAGAIPEFRLG